MTRARGEGEEGRYSGSGRRNIGGRSWPHRREGAAVEALLEAELRGALPAAEVPDAAVDAHVLELRHGLRRRM